MKNTLIFIIVLLALNILLDFIIHRKDYFASPQYTSSQP